VKDVERMRANYRRDRERECEKGRELMRKKDTVGAKIRTFSQTPNRNVI
jgi:hypothetical protein